MAVVSGKSFTVENEASRSGRGPLVRVMVNGRFVKMYQADAVAQGLLAGEPQAAKARPAPENKARPAGENKEAAAAPVADTAAVSVEAAAVSVAEPASSPEAQAVDFTSIDGVGQATARRIVAQGIGTYEQLRQADLGFLSSQQQQAIKAWIEGENG